jgi:hypothetical protein
MQMRPEKCRSIFRFAGSRWVSRRHGQMRGIRIGGMS